MEEYILDECRKHILKFHNMSDTEIYIGCVIIIKDVEIMK